MGERQFSGLPIDRQEYWAKRYKDNFPNCRIEYTTPIKIDSYIMVKNLPTYQTNYDFPPEIKTLKQLDDEVYHEWLNVKKERANARDKI